MNKVMLIAGAVVACVVVASGLYLSSATARDSRTDYTAVAQELLAGENWEVVSVSLISEETENVDGVDVTLKKFEAQLTAIEARYGEGTGERVYDFVFVNQAYEAGHSASILFEVAYFDWRGQPVMRPHITRRNGVYEGATEADIFRSYGSGTIVVRGTPEEEEALAAIEERKSDVDRVIEGEWRGVSDCRTPGNVLEFHLTFSRTDTPNQFTGEMRFSPVPESTYLETGHFLFGASFNRGMFTGPHNLTTNVGEWLERPRRHHPGFTLGANIEDGRLVGFMGGNPGRGCEITLDKL